MLTQISRLFSKKESDQLLGITLRQESIAVCSLPAQTATEDAEAFFQNKAVQSSGFSATLKSLHDDTHFIGQCHLVLTAQHAQIVQVDKPSVPKAEMIAALKWHVKDLVSISPDDMVLDYFDSPRLAGGQEKINVVCASLSELKEIVSAINQENIQLKSITTQEFAFANLLPYQEDACLLVCQQPDEEITLLIVKQGKLYFHRRLRGFAQIANKNEDELAMSVIDNLSLELQRSTDYFERQLKQAPIKDIKILLPIEHEDFFARKLAENTNVPVVLLAVPEPYQQRRNYAAAIGATLFENSNNASSIEGAL
ncbi:MAG: MSHA biogenesis protein MshI [Colwellia sp.]